MCAPWTARIAPRTLALSSSKPDPAVRAVTADGRWDVERVLTSAVLPEDMVVGETARRPMTRSVKYTFLDAHAMIT